MRDDPFMERGHSSRRRCRRAVVVMSGCALLGHRAVGGQAPTYVVHGVVADSTTKLGIARAEVTIEATRQRTVTDERGEFRLSAGAPAPGVLRVRRLGFRPREIVIRPDVEDASILIRLESSARDLPPVVVRAERTRYTGRLAGYYERLERRALGQFISRRELERENPVQLTDMLRRAPGVELFRGRPGAPRLRLRGRDCSPLIWLDGAALTTGDVDLDAFSPASLEGIELYLGAMSAPGRYQGVRGQSQCGTILLWSRGPDTEPPRTSADVAPADLESMLASLGVFTAEQVDRPVQLDTVLSAAVLYPMAMRVVGSSGAVAAEFVVDVEGHVEQENIGIVSATNAYFGEAVRDALRSAVFRPAQRQNHAVRQLVRQRFEFGPTRPDGDRRQDPI